MTGTKEKNKKSLYGRHSENLGDESDKIIRTVESLKLFQNKKISDQVGQFDDNDIIEFDDSYEIINSYKPTITGRPNSINRSVPKIKNSKVSISYHKPKPVKKYFGSKTDKSKKNNNQNGSKKKSNEVYDSPSKYHIKNFKEEFAALFKKKK